MASFNPVLWRTARLIHDQLLWRRRRHAELYLPQIGWAKTQRLVRQLEMARSRGWDRSTTSLRRGLLWQLERMQCDIDRVIDALKRQQNYLAIPSVQEVACELNALVDEFEELQCKPRQGRVSVTTQPIVLDKIEFGRFQIELDIKALSTGEYYRVIALEPNPAWDNDSVTHPHVQSERLCEGEGHVAIQDALAEGRLLDFFLIVSRLLSNYGQGSAYVELKDWRGLPCECCGASTGEDGCYCQTCDDRLCNDCACWCNRCDAGYCDGCISTCQECGESHCPGCLEACADCQEATCSNCLDEGRCHACRTEQSMESAETLENEAAGISPPTPSAGLV